MAGQRPRQNGPSNHLILRPNGLVERMDQPASAGSLQTYASERPGWTGADELRLARQADRRRRRRPALDPLKGRLIDLLA